MIKNNISLLPHNQKLFDEIMEAINNGEHSIFYSEATGLGKSFIFMRLVYNLFSNEGDKVLYIVPKLAIWENIQSYKEFEYIKDYVEITTYADFNSIKIKHYDYDAIFIDECHHLASDIQGANILDLCKEYVEADRYIFGFTATPEIKVKKEFINVDKYFNYKIYGMDAYEAIEAGLFNDIQYAIADHDTIINDKEYCKKYSIDGTKTLLENLLHKHAHINKWLVYFSNISDLNKNKPSIEKLFPNYKIFIMHSRIDNNDEELNNFNSYDGKCMLLTVSMVLEGIHPKNIGGILLYRNVTNHHTLLQVLGRVCDINKKISPVFIDITKCVNTISLSYLKDCAGKPNQYTKRNNSIRPIIDVKASTYKYIELIYVFRTLFNKSGYTLAKEIGCSDSYVYERRNKGMTDEQINDEYEKYKSKKHK